MCPCGFGAEPWHYPRGGVCAVGMDTPIRALGASNERRCADGRHFWPENVVEGDTCNCGAWYRFHDRIEATP